MRILIVNTYYHPNIVGGTENSVKILAENLIKHGHDVAIYCIDNNHNNLTLEFLNGVKIYRSNLGVYDIDIALKKNNNIIKKFLNKVVEFKNYSIESDLNSIISDFNPDIIHTNNLYGISPYIWEFAYRKGIKIIHTLRDYWLLSPKVSLENLNQMTLLEKFFINNYQNYFRKKSKLVDIVTAPSNFTLSTFKNYKYFKNARYEHINNAIEVNLDMVETIINEKKTRTSSKIKFIFVGALNKMKGIDILLKVFNSIDNPLISLTICGDGEMINLVKEYCNMDNRIIYKGKLNKFHLEEQLKLSDVLIVPSMWDEPFGRVVIEANQFGNPVIGSNRGGIKEIIDNIHTGRLFDSSNEEELKNLILFFSNRDNVKLFYDNILDNIEIYSIEHQIKCFEKLYQYR